MTVPFLFNDGVLSLVLNGEAKVIDQSHPNFKKVRNALKDGTDDELLALIEADEPEPEPEPLVPTLKPTKKKKVTVTTDGVFYDGEPIDNKGLTDRIALLQHQQLPFDGMVKFIERLFENMSFRNREELLSFVDRNGLTIDSEGFLICYKAVQANYMDKYSGKVDNHPGQVVEMKREKVDDDFRRHCSKGLHAGALEYVYWYGGGDDRIVIVKIDPADVVSVPSDHGCQKLRTCKYEVIGDYQGELQKVCYESENSVPDWYVGDLESEEEDDFDWDEISNGTEEGIEDDFFDDGDVTSQSNARCHPVKQMSSDGSVYGFKPQGSSQAGRKFWNNRGSNGKFAPVN